ncbi:MAG: 30S ribosomal protein S16 [Flavobacteriales bacterium]|nr:30S ribosomal protein S16 [Flavobacteriales bacterium]
MATKIRLQRHGRKRRPIFHIVVADSRAPRDGKYIERLGLYNPNTNPATINLDFERSLYWVQTGAQSSDTANAILSYKGVLHKDHLLRGVKKGALSAEQAEEKFAKWLEEKEGKIMGKITSLSTAKEQKAKDNLERETKAKQAKADKILAKNSPLAEEVENAGSDTAEAEVAAEATEIESTETVAENEVTETTEETANVVAEETSNPFAEETPAEETQEEKTSEEA